MVTIPKALDRKIKRALLRDRCRWGMGKVPKMLLFLISIGFGTALIGLPIFAPIYNVFDALAGYPHRLRLDTYFPIATVCFAIVLLVAGLVSVGKEEIIGRWPRYNDALAAVLPNCRDEPLLHELALHYPDEKVQRTAIASMQDQELLADFVRKCENTSLCCAAVERMRDEDPLWQIALSFTDVDDALRLRAVEKIQDMKILTNIALYDGSDDLSLAALQKIDDEDVLCEIVMTDPNEKLRLCAVQRIQDEETLIEAVLSDESESVRLSAVKKLDDEETLIDVAKHDESESVRLVAKLKTGHANELLEILDNPRKLSIHENTLDLLLEYADLLTMQEKERLLRIVVRDAKVLFGNRSVCKRCGSSAGIDYYNEYPGYYDGYNHSNPDLDHYICRGCRQEVGYNSTVPRHEYETERIRNLLKA